jgi:hypothetical protein
VSKLHCTSRAEWRLRTGKTAEALSPHYRLDCDYGTPVIVCWEQGGAEPIYVCDTHAKQLGNSREHGPDARVITVESENGKKPIKQKAPAQTPEVAAAAKQEAPTRTSEAAAAKPEAPTQTLDVAVVKPKRSASPKPASSVSETKVVRTKAGPTVRTPVRDVTYGNSAKAMVDEVIWNMATGDIQVYKTALQQGKSASEAAQAAGGQLAVIHQKIGEYALKLEAILTEAKVTINAGEAIDKPLEQAVLETISDGAMSDTEKDAAVQQLGAIQAWVKQGLKGDMTPLEAHRILLAIGERVNWGGATGVPENFKPVYRALFRSLKSAIQAAVPEAQNLQDRLTNLSAAKAEMEIG